MILKCFTSYTKVNLEIVLILIILIVFQYITGQMISIYYNIFQYITGQMITIYFNIFQCITGQMITIYYNILQYITGQMITMIQFILRGYQLSTCSSPRYTTQFKMEQSFLLSKSKHVQLQSNSIAKAQSQ